jgi:maspardin
MTSFGEFRRRFPERNVMLSGGEWQYFDTGGLGPALVMLPGGQGTGEVFYRQAEDLGADIRMLGLCYPDGRDPVAVAMGLRLFIEALGLEQVNLLGTSYGGYIAQLFSSLYPEACGCLILSNSFVDPAPAVEAWPSAEELEAVPAETLRANAVAKLRSSTDLRPNYRDLQALLADQLEHQQSADSFKSRLVGVRSAPELPISTIPQESVVIIDCDDDPVLPPVVREQLATRYPSAERHSLSWGDHYPAILRADEYSAVVANRLIFC